MCDKEKGSDKDGGGKNSKGDSVRNICIMAHVDHGKTTLADALIATNGIISQGQAGTLRYMDSRKDEMEKGITMKSSCITLGYPYQDKNYLINLVDSPGHVDFSSEVSTAVRLCDGCILVVDVVEGVCAQTKAVMRQAWSAGVKPVLLLNKLDRLVIEKEMTPLDAYYHIAHVLEQVNAYMGELHNTEVLGRTENNKSTASKLDAAMNKDETESSRSDKFSDWVIEDEDDSHLYFNPAAGNVVFSSAVDSWGFGISHFAEQFSDKLGMSYKALSQTLWGDFYISNKNGQKRILKGARDKRKNPLFVSLILENLYMLYRKVRPSTADADEVSKIALALGIKLPRRLLSKATDPKERFMFICSNWLPLSKAVLGMVVDELPAPTMLTEERGKRLLTTATHDYSALPQQTRDLLPHFLRCSNDDTAPLVVYVSKMFGVPRQKLLDAEQRLREAQALASGVPLPKPTPAAAVAQPLQQNAEGGDKEEQPDDDDGFAEEVEVEDLLAFARVFSGSIKPGQEVYVLGPKHNPASVIPLLSPEGHLSHTDLQQCSYISRCKVGSIFLLLGREVKCLGSAGAGLMIGISGLTEHIVKSGSISSVPVCPPFTHVIDTHCAINGGKMTGGDMSGPILRVLVLPENPRCLGQLREGLKLLNQADPCVKVWLEKTGEYMIGAAGEVHLQRCLRDLEERYARISVKASDPIVPFRETVVAKPLIDKTNEIIEGENVDTNKQEDGDGTYKMKGCLGTITVRILPLPSAVSQLLIANSSLLAALGIKNDNNDLTKEGSNENSDRLVSSSIALKTTDHTTADDSDIQEDTVAKSDTQSGHQESKIVTLNPTIDGSDSNETATTTADDCDTKEDAVEETDAQSSHEESKPISLNPTIDGSDSDEIANRESCKSSAVPTETPGSINSLLNFNKSLNLLSENPEYDDISSRSSQTIGRETKEALDALKKAIGLAFDEAGEEWIGAADQMWSVGPHYCGPNVLLNRINNYNRPSVWQTNSHLPTDSIISSMDHGFVTGFQLCSAAGTLCEEPLMGVCFVVEDWQPPKSIGALSPGRLIAISKDLLSRALEEQPRRMMMAMYSCVVSVTADVVGRVYSVICKRQGRILKGDITEGSTSWNVTAYLPIVESIDFANELRKATSGEAQPMLMFSHWEIVDIDPYWDPRTAEELKHFGDKADTENLARHYMNNIRRRKGIKEYGKKLVEFGEKQRTLTKNK